MSMDDLKRVQRAGWLIVASDEDKTIAKCPANGCGLCVSIPHGAKVQSCDPGLVRAPSDIPVGNFEDLRQVLRDRRRELLLTIPETESVSGLSVDHIAKAEKENPVRLPNVDTVIYWAGALGFELVLRPTGLPPAALRIISETRQFAKRRRGRHGRPARPSR